MKSMIPQLLYIAVCLAGVIAIFHVQRYRIGAAIDHSVTAAGCRWWLYNVLAVAILWEAIDAYKYGPPGWPASRWLLMPAASATLVWTAVVDWLRRRRRPSRERRSQPL